MKFPERSQGVSKDLLKMKAGESVVGVFRGELYEFRQHWGQNKSSLCSGADCPKCAAGDKGAYRFRLNFVMKENAALVAKVFEQGWTVREQLEALNKDYPLEQHFVKITRNGNGKDTSYMVLPIPNSALNAKQEKEVANVSLVTLDPAQAQGAKAAQTATDQPFDEDSVPF